MENGDKNRHVTEQSQVWNKIIHKEFEIKRCKSGGGRRSRKQCSSDENNGSIPVEMRERAK